MPPPPRRSPSLYFPPAIERSPSRQTDLVAISQRPHVHVFARAQPEDYAHVLAVVEQHDLITLAARAIRTARSLAHQRRHVVQQTHAALDGADVVRARLCAEQIEQAVEHGL